MALVGTHRLPQVPQPPLKGAPKMGVPAPLPMTAPAVLAQAPPPAAAQLVIPPMMPPLPPTPPPRLAIPPVMPPLPAIPPANPWSAARNPSANMVQQQYLDVRLAELGASCTADKVAALQVLEQYLLDRLDPNKKHKKIAAKELLRIYGQIERNLQSSELTINFHAHIWFANENPYDTYTQMYERAMQGDQMVLSSTGMNDATARAEVDNQITFPDHWQGVQTTAVRGLQPGRQGVDRIMKQMDTGALVPKPVTQAEKAYNASNRHFNPHTKQIFLGLNYGRRPHGSAMNFGRSFLVFKSGLKPRCVYYACDTFLQREQGTHAGGIQVAYDNLAAILGKNSPGAMLLRDAIFKSCYEGKLLPDPEDTGYCKFVLLEAHHFGELNFRDHAEKLVISPRGADPAMWPTIVENARKFAKKHGLALYQTN